MATSVLHRRSSILYGNRSRLELPVLLLALEQFDLELTIVCRVIILTVR